ncbi:MAG TPA: DUF1330 domain-containing protein [Dehalococcoidia bacterium]|nr:DUF1330 domain-containing protein [Dehalococcoidia bacterium]
MPAYVIATVDVTDPATYEEYRKLVPATLEQHGGKFLVRGGKYEIMGGTWDPKRVVVLEFESVERAKQWWSSEEYRVPKEIRQRASISNLIIVEGAA